MVTLPHVSPELEQRLRQIDLLALEWQGLAPLAPEMRDAQRSYDEDFLVRMAYDSNAIEGSTLTLAETEVIYEGEFVPGRPGREQVAARGIFEGFEFLEDALRKGRQLNEELLKDLHERCALDLQPRARGVYRSAPAVIRASRTAPADPYDIRPRMSDLFFHYALQKDAHPLPAICWFHAELENIHPFADGNGRTGRLWMNAQLMRAGYPAISIKAGRSMQYKTALEAWQVDGKQDNFLTLFLDCAEEALQSRIAFLSQWPSGPGSAGAAGPASPASAIPHGPDVLDIIASFPAITAKELGVRLSLSERQVQRVIRALRDQGLLRRVGGRKYGTWEIVPWE